MPEPTTAPKLSDKARKSFAVVVPAFDEAPNMPDLVRELRATFERHDLDGEVLIVDDGSSDGTGTVALREANGWKNLRVLTHRRNFGKTEALLTAADATNADWLILFDADLQHTTEEIPRYLAKLDEGWDIVTGRKLGKYQKQKVSRLYNYLNKRIFKVHVSDLNSLKGFKREILDEVYLRHDWHRFFVVLAYARGFSITELPIDLYPRRHGESKYGGLWRIVVGLMDLLSVAFFLFFSRKPLLLFGFSGLMLAGLGLVVGLVTIVLRIIELMPPFGFRPLLYLVILLETLGFLLFGFGMIAEQVAQQEAEIDALRRRLAQRK